MYNRKKCISVFIIILMYAALDFGGKVFTDKIYSPIVLYLGFIILTYDYLKNLNNIVHLQVWFIQMSVCRLYKTAGSI